MNIRVWIVSMVQYEVQWTDACLDDVQMLLFLSFLLIFSKNLLFSLLLRFKS